MTAEREFAVIPGWSEGPDPESRDSGFGAAHRPGMTLGGEDAHRRLRAAVCRRAGRRICLWPGRLRHGADGAGHLALCAATLACGAAHSGLFGGGAELDVAVDVAEL